jgi:glycerophosphoryl diester phosphodiesterase
MHPTTDPLLSSLLAASPDTPERALAARYAPIIYLDANEPFPPLVVGYTLFRHGGPSPSFRQGHDVDLTVSRHPRASVAIEYAIWSDWDIGHLYELEHVWVYVDEHGTVVRGEASWHGDIHDMRHQGHLELHGDHLALYSEPGKHAFAPTVDWFKKRRQEFKRSETSVLAGCSGVLITPYLQEQVKGTPLNHRLVRSYLAQKAFEPSWQMSNVVEIRPAMLVPWPELLAWIPGRVNDWLARLARDIPPSRYRFLRIGHRGAAAHAPHNTLAGLRKAAALGADMAEFDVQQTADGHTVLAHDSFLADAEGRPWLVRHSTLAQLQAIDLGEGERIPTLDQALATCQAEQLGAYIELKDGNAVGAVADALHRYDWEGQSIVGSFQPDAVAELKTLAPRAETSILFGSTHLDAIQLARSLKASYVHPCWERFPNSSSLLTPEWIARVRQADMGIICWHEERPAEIAALQQLGVDGICSDSPELLLGALP